MFQFLKKVLVELKKVSWPTPYETWQKTLVVIGFVAIVMAFCYAVDLGITTAIRHLGK